jgi:hypothetical protein
MPPTTRNKSRSASRKSGSSGRKATSKCLDKENAELKRKLAQYEAEEAQKTAKKPPEDPEIPSHVGATALTKDQVTKDEMAAIQKAVNHHTFCATTIFLPMAGDKIWTKVMQKIYLSLHPPHPLYLQI